MSLICHYPSFLLSFAMFFKPWLRVCRMFEDPEWDLTYWILPLVFDIPMFQILLSKMISNCKTHLCTSSLDWGLWGYWRFLTMVSNLAFDLIWSVVFSYAPGLWPGAQLYISLRHWLTDWVTYLLSDLLTESESWKYLSIQMLGLWNLAWSIPGHID